MNGEKMDWSLRLARPADAELMPAIERAAAKTFGDVPGLDNLDPEDVTEVTDLLRFIRKGHSLVTHVGERMVGFLVSEPIARELHIWELDVHPDFQGRGIGAGLVRAAQVDARNSGFNALTLTTFRDVKWNAPFYARLGFEEVTALDAHARLAGILTKEANAGLPAERRCAMICFLD
ncbi:MAG: GNAT family N-acetyltransferase [Pseudomonadota bacterium]